jgi:LemA protein
MELTFGTILLAILCVVLAVAGLIGLFAIGLFNRFQRLQVLVEEAWSGIDVQLKKRFDLIPNLVETVKGYAKQEKDLFENVARLRSGMMNTQDPQALGQMEGELRSTLKTLFAVAESYPELKSNENFMSLQNTLQEIETELEGARRYYNGVVRDLNTAIVTFPSNIIAGMLNLKRREFFEVVDATERQNVKVQF